MDSLALPMSSNNLLLLLLLASVFFQFALVSSASNGMGFTFNDFRSVKLDLDGVAELTPNGLLQLTNKTEEVIGHAFYPDAIPFKGSSGGFSFSTTFVFAIVPEYPAKAGGGLAFVAASQKSFFAGASSKGFLGLFNQTNNGSPKNRVFAVEFDTKKTDRCQDMNDNHVGIDINSVVSNLSAPAGYYTDGGKFENLTLISGRAIRVWVDYDGARKQIEVTLAPLEAARPSHPLLSLSLDLSQVLDKNIYVGFSSASGSLLSTHYILGWSFRLNGRALELDLSKLPSLPRIGRKPTSRMLTVGVPVLCIFSASVLVFGVIYYIRRKRKFAEILEDWELNCRPHRFKYKDLYVATAGFRDQDLLGAGGFGRVYKGTMPDTKVKIAVKRISHDSRQGIREFVAEVVSIGRLRHCNIVTLLGYCRRKGELLLVYDYMPNGSLDMYLFNQPTVTLNWSQRFRVIKGVASGLLYLHEGWDQVVIHRKIKASNVLLDAEFNGRLGDFGLAWLCDRGKDPQNTRVFGTLGYFAPEHARSGKATKATDVFAFGAFLLEVATGRRPIEAIGAYEVILVDWVLSWWNRGGDILEARDPNLGEDFVAKEVELVLKLGMACSQAEPRSRPTMRQVIQFLEGDVPIEDFRISPSELKFEPQDEFVMSYPSSDLPFSAPSTIADSLLSGGR